MAVTAKPYGKFMLSLANKEVDLDGDQLKCLLVTSAYTFDQDAHQYKSSVTGEVSGTGYTPGGVVLTSVTLTYNASNNTLTLDSADPTWNSSTITNARGAIFYDNTPASDAIRPLISYADFGEDKSTSNGTFQVILDATGIVTLTAA